MVSTRVPAGTAVQRGALRPQARGRQQSERGHGPDAGKLQRDPAAQGVPGDIGRVEAEFVEQPRGEADLFSPETRPSIDGATRCRRDRPAGTLAAGAITGGTEKSHVRARQRHLQLQRTPLNRADVLAEGIVRRRTLTLAVAAAAVPAAVLPASAAITSQPARDAPYTVAWAACAGAPHVQCGTLSVPLDWSKPQGEHVSVAVARRPADDKAHRVGTLFFNPGGPGDGAAGYVQAAEKFFSAELRARFDLVGMDPRATGGSTKVHCGVPVLTPAGTLFPRTEAQFQALLRHNREVGASC